MLTTTTTTTTTTTSPARDRRPPRSAGRPSRTDDRRVPHSHHQPPTEQDDDMYRPEPTSTARDIGTVVAPRVPDGPRPRGRPAASAPTSSVDAEAETRTASPSGRAPAARCADGNGTLTALFFSDNVHDIARAKAMCGLCPLRSPCLDGALEREEPWGVWGGELLSGGRIIANKRPCGRPPKRPRPEIVYDEMGPVGVVA